jgi:photosystem II stability/assembly factor-like uncharacterized protein
MTRIDLNEDLGDVRAEVVAQGRLPELAELAKRGARRRRRDWAVVMVAAVACTGVLLATLTSVRTVIIPPVQPTVIAPTVSPTPPPNRPKATGTLGGLNTLDSKVGYADVLLTAGGEQWLRTSDGGQSWQQIAIPSWYVPHYTDIVPVIFDRNVAVFGNAITHDGGKTWERRPAKAGPAVSQVPPGAQLVPYDPNGEITGTETPSLGVLDPANGQIHPLSTAPSGCHSVLTPPKDGSLWAACGSARGVAISHDRGASWRKSTIAPSGKELGYVDSYDGRIGYATVGSAPASFDLYRTEDSGVTWSLVRSVPWATSGFAVVPDGSLLFGNGKLVRSADEGASFSTVTPPGSSGGITRGVGGYQSSGMSGPVYMSDDGVHFVLFRLPAGVG